MPDVDEDLRAFGRWLDGEIDRCAADRVPLYPPAVRPVRRHRSRALVVAGAVAASVAAAVAMLVVVGGSRPPTGPLVPLTVPPSTGPATTVPRSGVPPSAVSSTGAPSSPGTPLPTVGPATATPTTSLVPPPSRPTTSSPPASAVAPVPTTAAAPSTVAPVPTVGPTTATPPPATDPPPPTEPPPTTAPAGCYQDVRRVGRSGTVDYTVCADGVRLMRAQAIGDWVLTVVSPGPPILSVTFTLGTQVVSCTISTDGTGGYTTTGSC